MMSFEPSKSASLARALARATMALRLVSHEETITHSKMGKGRTWDESHKAESVFSTLLWEQKHRTLLQPPPHGAGVTLKRPPCHPRRAQKCPLT